MKKIIPLTLKRRIALRANETLVKMNDEGYPMVNLFWECTLRCNLLCKHCGSDCKKESEVKDMPKEDFLRVVDEVAAHSNINPNKVLVIFTGGEALMRKDLEECGQALYEKGFPWGIVTNGYALNKKRLDSLLDSGLRSVTVSLDGFEEDHDWMRGVKGSFKKASEAIKLLADAGIIYDVVTCVNKRTLKYLPELKEYLLSLGLKEWRLFTIFPLGRAAQEEELSLTSTEFRQMLDFISETRKEGKIKASYGCEGFLGNYEGEVRDHIYKCSAGVNIASVLADGSISACPSIRANYSQGNIYQDSFMDVWENRFEKFRDRSWMKVGECGDCKYFRYCKGNGMHLRNDQGELILCHLKKLTNEN